MTTNEGLPALRLEDLQTIADDPDAIVYVRDEQGRYVFVNDNYGRLLPFTREQVLGKTNRELHGDAALNWESADSLTTATRGFVVTTEQMFDKKRRRWRKFVSTKVHITLGGQPHLAAISIEIDGKRDAELEIELGKLRAKFIEAMEQGRRSAT